MDKVNKYLETSKKGIRAVGDAIGKHMFPHTSNHESKIVSHDFMNVNGKDERKTADFMRLLTRSSPIPMWQPW